MPTVGQIIHYYPSIYDEGLPPTIGPLAAIVASVIVPVVPAAVVPAVEPVVSPFTPPPVAPPELVTPDKKAEPVRVNLMVIDANGWTHSRTNVALYDDGADPVPMTAYAGYTTRKPKDKQPVAA